MSEDAENSQPPSSEDQEQKPNFASYRVRQSEVRPGLIGVVGKEEMQRAIEAVANDQGIKELQAKQIARAFEIFREMDSGRSDQTQGEVSTNPTPNSPEEQKAPTGLNRDTDRMYKEALARDDELETQERIQKLNEQDLPPNPVTLDKALKMPDNPTQESGNSSSGPSASS